MSDRCVPNNDSVAGRPTFVDSIQELGFLEDAQVHVGLFHPPQCQLNSFITAISYVIQSKPNQRPGFVQSLTPLPSPHSRPCTPTHSLTAVVVSKFLPSSPASSSPASRTLPSPLSHTARTGLPHSRSRSRIPILLLCCSPFHVLLCSALLPGKVSRFRG